LNDDNLDKFIKIALQSKGKSKIFSLNILSTAIQKIKIDIKLNISNYKFIIKEEYIRHIKNKHLEDLEYIVEIPNILNNYDEVEKSIIRNNQTGQNEVSLVFRKQINNNNIQMVALRIYHNKILSLKTLFTIDIKK
jgi:hypothetical protein